MAKKQKIDYSSLPNPINYKELPDVVKPEVDIPESSRIAYEHNNPGNLMYVKQEGATKGEPKEGGGYWAKFNTPESGFSGLIKDIKSKQEGRTASGLSGSSTLAELINVYAPPSENKTSSYIENIASKLGVKEDVQIKDLDAVDIAKHIAAIESGTVIDPDAEIKEKSIEASAYDAGLIPELKPFTPETYVAKQSDIQQFIDSKNNLDAQKYFTYKMLEDEAERKVKVAENAIKLGLDPEFLDKVVDINMAATPIPRQNKQTEDYLLGSLGSFNEGLAEVFRTFDRASSMMADAVGLEWKNPIWDTMSEGLSKVGAEGAYKVPDDVVGNIMGGVAGMAPDLMITYFMPEMKLAQLGKITSGAITKIPKFPTWLGAKQGLQAYAQSGESTERYRDFFTGAGHGFIEGLTYEALGLTGAEAGKLAKSLGAGGLMTEAASGIASGTLFGTHGALMHSDFLETGQIDANQFFTDFGIGLAFHGKKIGEEVVNLATVNQSMLRKAHTSFWTSNRDLIRTGFVSPKSQRELRIESQGLWDRAIKAENPVEKNQLLMAKNAVDNIISSRAYAIMVGSNPKQFKEAIKNDERLSDKEKDIMLRKIEETADDFKATIEEGQRGTYISPDFDRFYEKPAEKLTETEKKKIESEKKLTETEEQPIEPESTKKTETTESLPKGEASAEPSAKKIKESEVKDAEETTQKAGESVPEKGSEGRDAGQGSIRDIKQDREKEIADIEKRRQEELKDRFYYYYREKNPGNLDELIKIEQEKLARYEKTPDKPDFDMLIGNSKRRLEDLLNDKETIKYINSKYDKELAELKTKEGIEDGINGNERTVSSGRGEMREEKREAPKQDEKIETKPTKGETEPSSKEEYQGGKAESEQVSQTEKIEISKGKIKGKKDFMDDVVDEVSRKAIKGKSERIIQEKQKQMDSEWKESEKKKNKELDKGVDVEIYNEATRETKQYRVRKKPDGSFVISSYAEKDAKGRPKSLSRAEDSGKIPGIRKKIMEAYRKKREEELRKEKSELEDRYVKEADAEVRKMTEDYLAQRKQESPKKVDEFQKEDSGDFPEKPTIMEGGKKQRPKLPSGGNKVTIEEMSGLRSEIQKWTRMARKERKETESEFEATSKSIVEKLKAAVDANNIIKGQYRTIIDRIGKSRTEKRRERLAEYVDKVLFGSEYKGQLKAAEKIISAIKKANKKDKSRFGDAYQRAVDVSNIDIKQLTIDELRSFNELAKKILAVKKVPNVEYLDAVLSKFGDKTKEEYDRFEARIEKAKQEGTLDKEISKIEKEFDDYIKDADILFGDIKTAADYITGQQKLNSARRRISKLLSEELITEEQAKVYEQKLGKLEESQGKWEESLDAFKKDYAESIYKSFSEKDTKSSIDELPAPEQRAFRELLAAKKEWIEEMPVRDLMALEGVVNNLRIGETVPEAYALKNKIEVMRKRSSDVDAAVGNVVKAKAWRRLQRQQFNNFNKWTAKKMLFWSKAAKNAEQDLRNVIRLFASTDKYRIDALLGNLSKKDSFYSQFLDVVKGMQSEANIKTEFSNRREKIFDDFVSSYKKFAGLVTLKEAEVQRKKIGNFVIERRYQNLPAFKNGEVTKDNASRVEMGLTVREGEPAKGDNTLFQRERKLWDEQIAEAKQNGLTKKIDGVDVLDIEKYETWLRKNRAVSKLIDEYDAYLKEMEPYAKAATMENGRTFIAGEKYSPYIRKNKQGEVEPETVLKEVQQGDYVPRMQAGATYALKGSRDWLENDIFKIMEEHSNDVFRNYFVKPQVVNSLRAIKESFKVKEASIKENQSDLNSIQTIRDALMIDMKDAVQKYYNSGKYAFELNKWHDKWLKGAKKGMLLHPARIPSELIANVTRGTLSTGFLPKEQLMMSKSEKEAFGSLFEQYIGDKYWSAYSPEISGYSTKRKWRRAVEDVADNFVMFSDKAIGVPLFRTQFSKLFTEITGKKFDAKEYAANPDYYIQNREAIDKSAVWATKRVEELFNAKTALSSAQMVKFMGNTVSFNSKSFWTRLLNTLQSFGRNEVEQLRTSGKRLASGDNEQIAIGLRDIASIITSNAIYGILRTGLGVAFAKLGNEALEKLGIDAPELTDYEKEQAENILKKDKIIKDLRRNEVSLMMGGSANIYSFASRVGMYALQDVLNEEQQEEVYSFMEDYMYASRIPEYGKPETVLKAMAPVPSPAIGDLFDTAESFENMILAIEKAVDGNVVSEKERYEILNLINLTMKYGMPNPVSPSLQRMLNRKIRELDNKGVFSDDNQPLPSPSRGTSGSGTKKNAPLPRPDR